MTALAVHYTPRRLGSTPVSSFCFYFWFVLLLSPPRDVSLLQRASLFYNAQLGYLFCAPMWDKQSRVACKTFATGYLRLFKRPIHVLRFYWTI